MTLAVNDRYVRETGDGTQTKFFYTFPVSASDELFVMVAGVLLNAGLYSVNLEEQSITCNSAPADGASVDIVGDTDVLQEILYSRQTNSYQLQALEGQLDRYGKALQEQKRDLTRSWKSEYGTAGGSITAGAEGTVAKFDADGNLVEGPDASEIANAEGYAEAAEAAKVLAEAAAVEALAVASALKIFAVDTLATVAALDLTLYDTIIVKRFASSGLLAPAYYKKVGADPGHIFSAQDSAGNWWEIAEAKISPAMAGATGSGDQSSYVQAVLDYVRTTYDATTYTFAKSLTVGNIMWRIENQLKLENLRQTGTKFYADGGGFYAACPSKVCFSWAGTQGCTIEDRFVITGSADAAERPLGALLLCRASFGGAFGGAGLHDIRKLQVLGEFFGFPIINYGSEVNKYPSPRGENRFKSTGKGLVLITDDSQYLTKWLGTTALTSTVTMASGAVSCIGHQWPDGYDMRRPSNWGVLGIDTVSNGSPTRVVLLAATTKIADGDATYVHDWSGMTETERHTYFLKKINDTTYDLYTNASLTTPLDSTSFGTFTGGNLWAASGPCVVIAGGVSLLSAKDGGYFLNYGASAIVKDSEYSNRAMSAIDFGMYSHEAQPISTVREITPTSSSVQFNDHTDRFANIAQDWRDAPIVGEQKGTGKISWRGRKVSIALMLASPAVGLVNGASCFNVSGLEAVLPEEAMWTDVFDTFNNVPTARIFAHDTNRWTSYGPEREWTPVLKLGGAATGWVTTVAGYYDREGLLVYAHYRIAVTTKGSSTGAVTIEGLPFTCDDGTGRDGGHLTGKYSNTATVTSIIGEVTQNTAIGKLYNCAAGNAVDLTDANLTGTSILQGTFIYRPKV